MPSVFAYLHYRTFLADWIAARRADDPGYSLATFARAGGCSKAALANVMSGARTPRPDTLDAFSRAMELTPMERNFLGLLVELDTAPNLAARRAVMDRLLSAERFGQARYAETEQSASVLRYFEDWYIPAIRELATLPGFHRDPAWIASTLRPRIRPDQAQQALDTLLELGLLREGPRGRLEPHEVHFRPHTEGGAEGGAQATEHVHSIVIPQLLQQLDPGDAPIQHLLAATFTVAPSQLPAFKARLDATLEQLAAMAEDRRVEEPARVYQLSIQLLPRSDEIGD